MYHGTLHRWRQPVIFDVAHAGRLLSATLAFWNIDKSLLSLNDTNSIDEAGVGRIKTIFDAPMTSRIAR